MKSMVIAWLVALPFLIGPAARADQQAPISPDGPRLYRRYCAACHGLSGRGDGVVSGFMRPHPADLTTLAARFGGRFPFLRVLRIIDGRETVRAHGDPDMPVWGEIFRAEAARLETARLETMGKLLAIVEYLRSIQRPLTPEAGEEPAR